MSHGEHYRRWCASLFPPHRRGRVGRGQLNDTSLGLLLARWSGELA